jgi:hypothetical protein
MRRRGRIILLDPEGEPRRKGYTVSLLNVKH